MIDVNERIAQYEIVNNVISEFGNLSDLSKNKLLSKMKVYLSFFEDLPIKTLIVCLNEVKDDLLDENESECEIINSIVENLKQFTGKTQKMLSDTFKVYKSCFIEYPINTLIVCIRELSDNISEELIELGVDQNIIVSDEFQFVRKK